VRAANRFSMPVFPASFNPPPISSVTVGGGSSLSPCRPVVPMPRCGVAVTVAAAEAARRLHGERRPCSDDVTTTSVGDRREDESLRAVRSRSVGALVSRNVPRQPSPPTTPQTCPTLGCLVADLQAVLHGLQGRHACLQALMDQLTAVDQLLKVIIGLLQSALYLHRYYTAVSHSHSHIDSYSPSGSAGVVA